jgi:phospholipid/cholesterol/gamma-HCH transport system permease protein
MPSLSESPVAQIATRQIGDALEVSLGGVWSIRAERPQWAPLVQGVAPRRLRFLLQDGTDWDSSLLLFLGSAQAWAREQGAACDLDRLPDKLRELLGKLDSAQAAAAPADRSVNFFTAVGAAAQTCMAAGRRDRGVCRGVYPECDGDGAPAMAFPLAGLPL